MEKYSQFRDRGTGIAPFFPVSTPLTIVSTITHTLLFLFRLPFFLTYALSYFAFFHWLPLPTIARKAALWGLMAIPGIWWVDLQLDGVKRGTLADQPPGRFPGGGSFIAANFTSPIDAVYLAAIFDPIFTISYPGSNKVQRVGLLGAIMNALGPVRAKAPTNDANLVTLQQLAISCPDRVIAVFPECGTTNGKAILPLCPALTKAPAGADIFPVSLRYTPSDVTTPVPGQWLRFFWNLLSRPTTLVRVRVAERQLNIAPPALTNGVSSGVDGPSYTGIGTDPDRMLDRVGEALARLSRVKRVGLSMQDKARFVDAWNGRK